MTPRSFWLLLLKILGLWLLMSSILVIIQSVGTLLTWTMTEKDDVFLIVSLFFFLTVIIYFLVIKYLILKPGLIIDKLKLDKGFSEEYFSFNIHHSSILRITVVVIGGLMLVDSLPALIRELYTYAQMRRVLFLEKNPDYFWIITNLVKTIIAFTLIYYNRTIVSWIELKKRNPFIRNYE